MTLLNSETVCIETVDQFKEKLNVENIEIIESLSAGRKEKLLWRAIQDREENDNEPINSIYELRPEEIKDFINHELSINTIVNRVLKCRDSIYTYESDISLFRITKIDDGQVEPTEKEFSVAEVNGDGYPNQIGTVTADTLSEAREAAQNQYGSPVQVKLR